MESAAAAPHRRLGAGDLDQCPQQLGDAGQSPFLVLPVSQIDDLLVGLTEEQRRLGGCRSFEMRSKCEIA